MTQAQPKPHAAEERKLVSVCVPVFNEDANVDRLIDRLESVALTEPDYDFEFLFTDNASTDRTFERLCERAAKDARVRVLRFSRNFGFQKSILTNYLNCRGHVAVQLDADLQDPPELISNFLRAWEGGFKVVYGVRRKLPEFFLKRWGRRLYYRLIALLSEAELPHDAGDFRLIDRAIIEELRLMNEQAPYLRGAIAAMGHAQTGVVYDRNRRTAGKSKFGFARLIEFGIDGITSQSTRPLRFVTLFGFAVSVASFCAAIWYLMYFLLSADAVPGGFTTLTLIGLTSLGLNALFIGLLGEYVGRIFNNTRGLPMAVITDRVEAPEAPSPDSNRTGEMQ